METTDAAHLPERGAPVTDSPAHQALVDLGLVLTFHGQAIGAQFGLTPQQWVALHKIGDAATGISPSELATSSGGSRPNTTKCTRRLIAMGYVYAEAHASDGRRKRLHLTAIGRAALQRLTRQKLTAATALLGPLSGEERATLAKLVNRMLAVPAPRPVIEDGGQ